MKRRTAGFSAVSSARWLPPAATERRQVSTLPFGRIVHFIFPPVPPSSRLGGSSCLQPHAADGAGRRALPPARPSGAPPGSAWLRPPPPGPARQRRRGRQFPVPRPRAALGPQCHSAPGASRAAAARPAPLRGTPAGSEQRRQPLGSQTGQWPRTPLVRAPAETTTRRGVRSGCRGPGVRRGTSASLRTDVGAAQDSAPPPPPWRRAAGAGAGGAAPPGPAERLSHGSAPAGQLLGTWGSGLRGRGGVRAALPVRGAGAQRVLSRSPSRVPAPLAAGGPMQE